MTHNVPAYISWGNKNGELGLIMSCSPWDKLCIRWVLSIIIIDTASSKS